MIFFRTSQGRTLLTDRYPMVEMFNERMSTQKYISGSEYSGDPDDPMLPNEIFANTDHVVEWWEWYPHG